MTFESAKPALGPFALPVLATGYFMLGVGSLSVVGLVDPMAQDLAVPRGMIAFLVTVFALTYAMGAPLMQMLMGNRDRRLLIVGGLSIIAAGAAVCALANSYPVVVVARIVMAIGSALVGPMVSAAAAALVPADRRGAALGSVFTGLTLATVFGVPVCSWGGDVIGWRGVMWIIAAFALVSALLVRLNVPESTGGPRVTFGALMGVMSDRVLAPAVLVTFMQMAAQFVTYALIAAYLVQRFGVPASVVPLALFIYGIGGVAGNVIATRLSDRLGFNRVILVSLAGLTLVFLALQLGLADANLALVWLLLWAIFGLMLFAPQQTRLVALAPDRSNLLLALNSSAIYLGMAGGSAVSGLVYESTGVSYLAGISLLLALGAIGVFQLSRRAEAG